MPKLPRLLRWISSVILLFLLLLTFFLLFFYVYYKPHQYPFPVDAFFMGLRLDLRVACVLGLLMLILCAVPFLNPFKNRNAKKFWVVFLSLLLYITDFFHYDYLHQRLNASVLNYMQDAGISLHMVWQTYPVIRSFLLIIVFVVAVGFLFSRLLHIFQKLPSSTSGKAKLWTIPFLALLIAAVWGTLSQFPLRWSDVFTLKDSFKAQLALNPMQSFFSTLSFRSSTFNEKKARSNYRLMANYLGVAQLDSNSLNYARAVYPNGPLPAGQKPN